MGSVIPFPGVNVAAEGYDVELSWLMAADLDEWADAHPCDCEALCVLRGRWLMSKLGRDGHYRASGPRLVSRGQGVGASG